MKKTIAALLAVLMLLTCAGACAESFMVHVTAICWDTNHVGTDWQGYWSVGGAQFYDGDIIEFFPGKYEFYTEIASIESSPDIGFADTEFNVTQNRLEKGFSVEQYLTVSEDKGSYKDYWCEWYITYEFTPVTYAAAVLR